MFSGVWHFVHRNSPKNKQEKDAESGMGPPPKQSSDFEGAWFGPDLDNKRKTRAPTLFLGSLFCHKSIFMCSPGICVLRPTLEPVRYCYLVVFVGRMAI